MTIRPSFDSIWMQMAQLVAQRSTCNRAQVGCVLVSDRNIVLSTGYGGSPRGAPHCTDVGCLMIDGGCKRTIHAEINAICHAANNGAGLDGCTAFVTLSPCRACTYALIQVGCKRIVYLDKYRITDHFIEVRYSGIDVEQYADTP